MTKPNKYNSKKVVVTPDGTIFDIQQLQDNNIPLPDGTHFDSAKEAEYYLYLKYLKRIGQVVDFELQPKYLLQDTLRKNGVTHKKITYTADFKVFYPNGQIQIIDVKGFVTKDFKIKRKLFEQRYPELSLTLITKHRGQWIETRMANAEKAKNKKARQEFMKRIKTMERKM